MDATQWTVHGILVAVVAWLAKEVRGLRWHIEIWRNGKDKETKEP